MRGYRLCIYLWWMPSHTRQAGHILAEWNQLWKNMREFISRYFHTHYPHLRSQVIGQIQQDCESAIRGASTSVYDPDAPSIDARFNALSTSSRAWVQALHTTPEPLELNMACTALYLTLMHTRLNEHVQMNTHPTADCLRYWQVRSWDYIRSTYKRRAKELHMEQMVILVHACLP